MGVVMAAEVKAEHEHRIVVGVDGSPSSKSALAWAIGQAKLTGAVVEAVTAWDYPATYGYAAAVVDVDWEGLAARVLGDAVSEVAPDAAPGAIRQLVSEGNAAQVILDASAGADLLVVGSRGHGGFVEALLGSVSQHAVHHATCPVVVIRDSVA
jgi:nucleotide-binding universal stress UspA family protein